MRQQTGGFPGTTLTVSFWEAAVARSQEGSRGEVKDLQLGMPASAFTD